MGEGALESPRSFNVHFELPPFEAGLLLAAVTKERMLPSGIDAPGDPLRRTAFENIYRILTEQLHDWQAKPPR